MSVMDCNYPLWEINRVKLEEFRNSNDDQTLFDLAGEYFLLYIEQIGRAHV